MPRSPLPAVVEAHVQLLALPIPDAVREALRVAPPTLDVPPAAATGVGAPEQDAVVSEDELRRTVIALVTGTRLPPTASAAVRAVRAQLREEIDAIRAAGGTVELPFEIPEGDGRVPRPR